MDQITTYTIKSKQNGFVWLFKYQLNGNFIGFEILDCQLSETQKKWLKNNFPFVEDDIKEWQKSLKDNFEIIKAEPILNFENLWNLYGNKVSKWDAEKAFNKLSDSDKIKCFLATPGYKKYLAKKGTGTAHLATFINRQYYNDDWSKA